MSIKLSQKQIGQRIAGLRKAKGLSQEDLAKGIKISRSSLAQIELGNRNVNILELQNLSVVLGFSLDDFVSEDFSIRQKMEGNSDINVQLHEERISVPTLQINKFKNVLLYILERCAGKPNVGDTVLYKLLYFSDFNTNWTHESIVKTGTKYYYSATVQNNTDQLVGSMRRDLSYNFQNIFGPDRCRDPDLGRDIFRPISFRI